MVVGELVRPNRNVRILDPVEMSAVRGLSLLPLEGLAPGVILGWTVRPLGAILGRAGGRIGQRRSATRAPASSVAGQRCVQTRSALFTSLPLQRIECDKLAFFILQGALPVYDDLLSSSEKFFG